MLGRFLILAINPGSTSTKIAAFRDEEVVFQQTIRHSNEELVAYADIIEQAGFRQDLILTALKANGISLDDLSAVVGRGGLLKPIEGGTYAVNEAMLNDLTEQKRGAHASNLGALLASEIAGPLGIPAFIVDPVCVDEMEPLARLSGVAWIDRDSLFHALNQKAIARQAAKDMQEQYSELNLIVVHLGGGITVGVHRQGRVIDVNNAVCGDGPFSPERAGGVPTASLIKACFSGEYTEEQLKKKLVGGGGLVSYLGTNDAMQVEEKIKRGDKNAQLIYEGMAYQISKEIGAAATVLKGHIDAILITGGLAHSQMLVQWIQERVAFLAPVRIYPGEAELEALAAGGLRVLRAEEQAKTYV